MYEKSIENWHIVLGHCNRNDVMQLEKVVYGMTMSEKKDFNCETLVLGKKVQVVNRAPDPRSKTALKFIHIDSGSCFLLFRLLLITLVMCLHISYERKVMLLLLC